jgi:hypothetical protein
MCEAPRLYVSQSTCYCSCQRYERKAAVRGFGDVGPIGAEQQGNDELGGGSRLSYPRHGVRVLKLSPTSLKDVPVHMPCGLM